MLQAFDGYQSTIGNDNYSKITEIMLQLIVDDESHCTTFPGVTELNYHVICSVFLSRVVIRICIVDRTHKNNI